MESKREPKVFKFETKPHVLIVAAPFYTDIIGMLKQGALAALERSGATHEIIEVPGALEIPAAMVYAVKSLDYDPTRRRFEGFIGLGCVIKGETMHDEIVGLESARGLQEIALRYTLAIGNGILTCNNKQQALDRADPAKQDRGGAAAEACLRMMELKHTFRLSQKRRWVAR